MPCTTDMDSHMTCTNSYITAWASTMTPYIHVSWSILMLLYHYCAHYGAGRGFNHLLSQYIEQSQQSNSLLEGGRLLDLTNTHLRYLQRRLNFQ